MPQAMAMMIADGLAVRAIDVRGFWSDVGTPDDLRDARKRFRPHREAVSHGVGPEPPEGWDREERGRAEALAAQFRESFSASAEIFAVRAPGRVNLIGEHTDYSGLPVLPVAIDRATVIVAARRDDSRIVLHNADSAYPARSFRVEAKIPPYPAGDWANYVKAAVQGVIDHFATRPGVVEPMRGATLAVDGRVPQAAGLSSSAALTVASSLAFMAVNGLSQTPLETAQMVARSERYVGTMAGGMDQAASMLGRRGHALFIQFDPLRATAVKMPMDAALVVADSLEVADKSGRVRDEYNRRVVECSLAARILGRALGLGDTRILGDVVKRLDRWDAAGTLGRSRGACAGAPPRDSRGVRAARGPRRVVAARPFVGGRESSPNRRRPATGNSPARAPRAQRDRSRNARGRGAFRGTARRNGRADERLASESSRRLRREHHPPRRNGRMCPQRRRTRRAAHRRGLRRMHRRARARIGCGGGAGAPRAGLLRGTRFERASVARDARRNARRPRRKHDPAIDPSPLCQTVRTSRAPCGGSSIVSGVSFSPSRPPIIDMRAGFGSISASLICSVDSPIFRSK